MNLRFGKALRKLLGVDEMITAIIDHVTLNRGFRDELIERLIELEEVKRA